MKNQKKLFASAMAAAIAAAMLLTGCGSGSGENNVSDNTAAENRTVEKSASDMNIPQEYDLVYSSISQVFVNDLIKMDSDNLYNTYGIDAAELESYLYLRSEDIMKADTIIIAKVNDEAMIDEIKGKFTAVNDSKAQEYQNYAPEQYDILQKSIIDNKDNYVYYVAAENSAEISQKIKDNI